MVSYLPLFFLTGAILRIAHRLCLACLAICLLGCGPNPQTPNIDGLEWDKVEQIAKGQTVRFAMWDGDPMINAYMRDYVVPQVAAKHGIKLQMIGGQGNSLVSKLLVDLEADRGAGDIDLMWINGETFYQLRKLKGLYGPFTDRLPNSKFVDWDNPFISVDFQQAIDGYECPWGNVQLAIIYHSDRVQNPPKNRVELANWVREHPGRFTFDNSFTGMTFLKSLLYELADDPKALEGPFDEAQYEKTSTRLWEYLKDIQPYLWKKGETFPEGVAQLHQLFMNNEVDFTMSNNDGEVDNKALQGILPDAARGYVWEIGTIRNSHFLGIPVNSPNKAAAMVLVNFMISPEAQYEKASPKVWGDGTILDAKRLPEPWPDKFANIPERTRVPKRSELEPKALMEPAPEIMVRLHEEFRLKIIEAGK